MRTIGLLGGMSWESSIEYERTINELVRERVGGLASADLLIRSWCFSGLKMLTVPSLPRNALRPSKIAWP